MLSTQLQGALTERRNPLDEGFVDRLRKEFLMLMRNLKRVKTYHHAEQLWQGFKTWRKQFEEYAVQVRVDLEGRIRAAEIEARKARMGSLIVYRQANADWARQHIKDMSPVWAFNSELGDFPLHPHDTVYDYRTQTFRSMPPEDVLQRYQSTVRKWEQRVRRKALGTWKVLKVIAEWTVKNDLYGGGGAPIKLQTREKVNRRIEGFRCQLVGYEPDDDFHVKNLQKFTTGLARYRKRALRVFPWLIRYVLPLELHFDTPGGAGDTGASYHRDYILITYWTLSAKKDRVANVIAHEMGHHLWQTVLRGEAQEAWNKLIRGGRIEIDLGAILKKAMGKEYDRAVTRHAAGEEVDMSRFEVDSLSRIMDRWEKEDPELALQVATILFDPATKDLQLWSLSRIWDYMNKGGDSHFMVPKRPITGYAAKNTEEAFCETLGLLVGYGPRTLHPEVRNWLQRFVPSAKLESLERS